MKRFNKKLSTLACMSVLTAASINADTFSVGFTTLDAITINEEQAMAFGPVLTLNNGGSCELVVGGGQYYDETTLNGADVTAFTHAAANDPIYFSSACALIAAQDAADVSANSAVTGTPARIQITASPGASVDVTVAGGQDATSSVTLAVDGYAIDWVDSAVTTDEAHVDLTNNTLATIAVSANGDSAANTDAGETYIVLGGTITNDAALTPGTTFTIPYTVTVNY
jgi:hypothetical protein